MQLIEALANIATLEGEAREAAAEVREARRQLEATPEVREARRQLEATPEGQALAQAEAEYQRLANELKEADAQARKLALDAYEQTGEKHPALGVEVKVFKRPNYDFDALQAWCEANRPSYVYSSLDVERVNQNAADLAKDGAPITILERPQVCIARDLGRYYLTQW